MAAQENIFPTYYFLLNDLSDMRKLMTAVDTAPALSRSSTLLSVITTIMPGSTDITDPEEKHEKRSLLAQPFESRYLGSESRSLEILPNGTVRGAEKLKPEYGVVKFYTGCGAGTIIPSLDKKVGIDQYGTVAIEGQKSGLFICMNRTGHVYGSTECTDECEFKELPNGSHTYTLYYSLKYKGPNPTPNLTQQKKKRLNKKWYLGIKRKTGEMLVGWKTKSNKKSTQFIGRPSVDPYKEEKRYSMVTTTKSANIDVGGSVSVASEENVSVKNEKRKKKKGGKKRKNRRRKKNKKNREIRNCDPSQDDPFDLFRQNGPCGKKKNRRRGANGQSQNQESLFASSTKRRHSNGSTSKPRRTKTTPTNLFSFPVR